MEETNYHRAPLLAIEPDEVLAGDQGSESTEANFETSTTEPKKQMPAVRGGTGADTQQGSVHVTYEKKTFFQKMALLRKEDLKKKNQMKGLVLRPLIFLTFPVIVFSGFMYGAIACYFNVLNGTASLILSAPPYNFSSSMVGLSYLSCLIGVFIG
jgi:hypothetical protein